MSESVPVENPIIVDITTTYGALLIACFTTCITWGISTLQTYFYYWNHHGKDAFVFKATVAILWLLDTAHLCVELESVWVKIVPKYGSLLNLQGTLPGAVHALWLEYLIVVVVRCYYLHRIIRFNSRLRFKLWIVTPFYAFIIILMIYELAGWIAYVAITFEHPILSELFASITLNLATANLTISAAVDTILAFWMVYLLRGQGAHFTGTKGTIHRLIIMVVHTGIIPAALAIGINIIADVNKGQLWYTILKFPFCSLYFSVFLANLNARRFVRGAGGIAVLTNLEDLPPSLPGSDGVELTPPALNTSSTSQNFRRTHDADDMLVINVTKQDEVISDGYAQRHVEYGPYQSSTTVDNV